MTAVLLPMGDAKLDHPMTNPRRRVLLLVESSRAYGRGCLRGIARYLRSHGGWICLHVERSSDEGLPEWFPSWRPDGIIARLDTPDAMADLLKYGLPIIDLRGRHFLNEIPSVVMDATTTCQMAAEHFQQRGFTNFAFCGYPGIDFSDDREQEYVAILARKKIAVDCFRSGDQRLNETLRRETIEMVEGSDLAEWLRALPKPVSIFACNDMRGRQVLNTCQGIGLRVPEEVAVLGVDNDEIVCEFAHPALSSIEPDTLTIGEQGAALLDRMMRGEKVEPGMRLVPPLCIVTRLSTDILAIDDPVVAQALAIIRENAFSGINVEELLDHLTISRATLERRFKQYLNRSPRAELIRLRVQKAQQLLRDTTLPLPSVAPLCGFCTASHLSVLFKRNTGISPGAYRSKHQSVHTPREI
jgi:LacI family transcriptional regulator